MFLSTNWKLDVCPLEQGEGGMKGGVQRPIFSTGSLTHGNTARSVFFPLDKGTSSEPAQRMTFAVFAYLFSMLLDLLSLLMWPRA